MHRTLFTTATYDVDNPQPYQFWSWIEDYDAQTIEDAVVRYEQLQKMRLARPVSVHPSHNRGGE